MNTSSQAMRRTSDPMGRGFPTRSYSTREVARLVEFPPRRLREMARHGLIADRPGPSGPFHYTFHDLVLLRNLQPIEDDLPKGKVVRLLCHLKQRLPNERPLHTLRFAAWGQRLVVREDRASWDVETGQVLMDFQRRRSQTAHADVVRPSFRASEHDAAGQPVAAEALSDHGPTPDGAEYHYALGCRLEDRDPEAARRAYLEALEEDPGHVDCHLNLGRLLHETGDIEPAAQHYAKACELRPDDATARFNLGVAYHDLGRHRPAAAAYRQALELDADCADAHYNLSLLHRQLGDEVTALRHLKAYRWLIEGR